MTSVLVVDDHPLVRKGLISLLTLETGLECTGEASNIFEALELIQKTKPEVALVDLRLGEESGFDLIKKALQNSSLCKFIILTSSARTIDIQKAKDIGTSGYILKEALPEELLYAIRLVSNGRKYYDPGILELMMDNGINNENDLLNSLTSKEIEVLRELGLGLSNREIASRLFITENTVKKHVSQILDKLQLADRTQAALFANVKGIAEYNVC